MLSPNCFQEEERERRMDFVPDESAINVDVIEVILVFSYVQGQTACPYFVPSRCNPSDYKPQFKDDVS